MPVWLGAKCAVPLLAGMTAFCSIAGERVAAAAEGDETVTVYVGVVRSRSLLHSEPSKTRLSNDTVNAGDKGDVLDKTEGWVKLHFPSGVEGWLPAAALDLQRLELTIPAPMWCANGNSDAGRCVCVKGFAGEKCDRCAQGYDGYPDCRKGAAVVCSGHGRIEDNACVCEKGYTGQKCDQTAGLLGPPKRKDDEPGKPWFTLGDISTMRLASYGLMAGGAVMLVVGSVAAGQMQDVHNFVVAKPENDNEANRDEFASKKGLAIAGYVVGVTMAGAGIGLFVYEEYFAEPEKPGKRTAIKAGFSPLPGGFSAGVGGSW